METETEDPKGYSRRQFFRHVSWSVLSFAGLAALPFIFSSIIPRKVIGSKRIPIGLPVNLPINRMTFLPKSRLFILRDHKGIAAMSAICTHLGCVVEQNSTGFICPCHGSSYNREGLVESGPAPQSLAWYQVAALRDGSLLVYLDHKVSPETRLAI